MREDRPERPCNRDASGQVTLGRRECVGGGCGFEEEERDGYPELSPVAGGRRQSVYIERLEDGDNDKDCCPTVVEGEGEVDEELVIDGLRRMILFDDVVDLLRKRNVVLGGRVIDVCMGRPLTVTVELTKKAMMNAAM